MYVFRYKAPPNLEELHHRPAVFFVFYRFLFLLVFLFFVLFYQTVGLDALCYVFEVIERGRLTVTVQ